jgi:beta-glucanase (GH16 family)
MKKTLALVIILLTLLCSCNLTDNPFHFGGTEQPDGNGASTMTNTPCLPDTACNTDPMATITPITTPATSLFVDEFDGTSLSSPFRPLPIWFDSPGVTDEGANAQAIWIPESAYVSGGYLHLQAEKLSFPEEGRIYSSGYVQSGGYAYDSAIPKKWFKYGYFEARIKAPSFVGAWPAFWLWADPNSAREIDVVEILMKNPNVTYHTIHNDGEIFQTSKTFSSPLTDWHTFAVDWQPGIIIWYVDGIEAGRYNDIENILDQEMYMILSLQLGGAWAGEVDESQLPAEMLVDYVRVWTHKP